MERDPVSKHYAWRRRVARALPQMAARTFALRGKHYMGCGTHYALERKLGSVIRFCNDFETRPDLSDILVEPLVVEELYRDLKAAEASSRDSDTHP